MSDTTENPLSLSQDTLDKHQEAFFKQLTEKGYFGDYSPSSTEYKEREEKARQKFIQGVAEQYKDKGNEYLTGKTASGHKIAVQLYEVAVKLYPHHTYLCNLCQAHLTLKDYKQAAEVGARAVERDPTFSKSYWRYGMALEKLGQTDLALEQFDKALELTPDNKQYQASKQNLLNSKK